MNVYLAIGLHVIFGILWILDSRTLQRRRDLKLYYKSEERMNQVLSQATTTLITELNSWRLEEERKNRKDDEEVHELSQQREWEEMKSRWSHPTNRTADFDIDISHILDDKLSERKKKPGPWYLIQGPMFQERKDNGRPDSGMWKKPESDE